MTNTTVASILNSHKPRYITDETVKKVDEIFKTIRYNGYSAYADETDSFKEIMATLKSIGSSFQTDQKPSSYRLIDPNTLITFLLDTFKEKQARESDVLALKLVYAIREAGLVAAAPEVTVGRKPADGATR